MLLEASLYLDIIFKTIAILLSTVAILQLLETKKRRKVDMYLKMYEIYTSDIQKEARENTVFIRDFIKKYYKEEDINKIIDLYSVNYHLTKDETQKKIDKAIIDRIRFLNTIGILINNSMIDRSMIFELIGLGLEHDFQILSIVIEAHRKDHYAPQMYSKFELLMTNYKSWKTERAEAFQFC